MPIKVSDITTAIARPSYKPSDTLALPSCMMGVEIEVENMPTFPSKLRGTWRETEEGSLRNHGREFVTDPIFGEDLINAINLFAKVMGKLSPEYSPRTSVHIHMDFRDASMIEVEQTLGLAMILERSLFNWVGNGREDSIYCVPVYRSYGLLSQLACELFITKDKKQSARLLKNWCKYTSINLLPLLTYGSIEFRHHFGTHDPARLLDWINILQCIKRAAQLYPDTNWVHFISSAGVQAFLILVFKDHVDLIKGHVNEKDIYLGLRTLQDLKEAYTLVEGDYSLIRCDEKHSSFVKYKHKGDDY